MTATCLTPFANPTTPPASSSESSDIEITEVENSDKVEWMFHHSHSCARCQAIRPQIRLLQALKGHADLQKSSSKILPDEVGWNSLASDLQTIFVSIFKLNQFLGSLVLEPVLHDSRESVVSSLGHLLSHLPFPCTITKTINMEFFNLPRTKEMASYLFGWKLKELISLLRSVYRNKYAEILPKFFKAEVCQVDKVSYKSLVFAVQGLRNKAIVHASLNSDLEFVHSSPPNDCSGIDDEDCSSSSESTSVQCRPKKKVKREGTSSQANCISVENSPSPAQNHSTATNTTSSALTTSTASVASATSKSVSNEDSSQSPVTQLPPQNPISTILQGLSLAQLRTMSHIVQSRIINIQSQSQGSSDSKSTSSIQHNTNSFRISVPSSSNVRGNPITPSEAAVFATKRTLSSQNVNAQSQVPVQLNLSSSSLNQLRNVQSSLTSAAHVQPERCSVELSSLQSLVIKSTSGNLQLQAASEAVQHITNALPDIGSSKVLDMPVVNHPISIPRNIANNSAQILIMNILMSSQPILFNGCRNKDTVVINWTFSQDLQVYINSHVTLYEVFFSNKLPAMGEQSEWVKVGSVTPLPLPMCVTLSNNFGNTVCAFSIRAHFGDTIKSKLSAPFVV